MRTNVFYFVVAALFTLSAYAQLPATSNQSTTISTGSAATPTNNPAKTNPPPALSTDGAQTNKPLFVKLDETTLATLRARPNAWWKDWLPLFSTLIGAVTALFGGYWATTRSHVLQVQRKEREDAEFVMRLESCIATELDLLGQFYRAGIGKDLVESKPLRVHFALTEKWFTVFEANANHLGKLEQNRSASIIKIYGLMKSMVEYFRINNLLLDQLEALERSPTNLRDDSEQRRAQLPKQMIKLAAMLKDLETNLKQEVDRFHSLRNNAS